MTYGRYSYGGVGYAGADVADIPDTDTQTTLAVEVAFTTDALADPVWVDVTSDVRSWDVSRGRSRELERFQPGRATVVLGNLSRQYDSVNAAAPQFGNIRPGKRMRIRETFNGVTYPVFDGFVDKWALDYPDKGKDATAVLTATDGFKFLARAELDRSVYWDAVDDDAPLVWWRLDEVFANATNGIALNSGTGGVNYNAGATNFPKFGAEALVVNDPGTSMQTTDSLASPGTLHQGILLFEDSPELALLSNSTFTVEAWVRLDDQGTNQGHIWTVSSQANAAVHATCGYEDDAPNTDRVFTFLVNNSAFTLSYGVVTPAASATVGGIHHVVCVVESSGQMAIWLNGTRYTTKHPLATASSLSGITRPTGGDVAVAFERNTNPNPLNNWKGEISNVAIWTSQLADARITAHYTAGTAPWSGDLPGARIGRALDEVGWPSGLRELDTGLTTFQSATITGQTALEHIQKASESEYGSLLFTSRDGKVRFVGRTATFGREPGPAVYGDLAGEVGYTAFTPDDGDEVIRNRAVVSRLGGVAKVAEDATSQGDFGRSDYVREGLLHNSETESLAHASFIVGEYADQRRRITSLDLGPPTTALEGAVYPAMLGPELGDAITVRSRPPGGGALFEQVCAIEGIQAQGAPGGIRTTRFVLSPEYALRTLEDVDVATLGYVKVTANQGAITSEVDLTGLTVTATVGSSRRVKVTGSLYYTNTGAAGYDIAKIQQDGVQVQERAAAADTAAHTVTVIAVETPSAGSHTWKLRAQAIAGTLTSNASATFPAFILVEDIGPV